MIIKTNIKQLMKSMIDVSVIIVNYNTYKVTQACIDSIFQYTKDIIFEIILVDNNSKDDSYDKFKQDKRIIYLYQETNLGFGKANNIGYEHSNGNYIFLLNSDTLLKSNAIKEFYDYMEMNSNKIAFVGTLLKDINNNIIHSYGNFPNLYTGVKWYSILGGLLNRISYSSNNQTTTNGKVDYVTGADIFIRKNVIEKKGLFDPDFFMYFEETELQYRYSKLGYESHIYSKPQIIHLENYSMNQSYNNNNLRKLGISLNSYFLYIKKCKGTFKYCISRILLAIIGSLWILHPKYTFHAKINLIKKIYA